MKKILITQRCDKIDGKDETRDGLDVRWAKVLFNLGFIPLPVCSELAGSTEYLEQLKPDGILLSGGNDIGAAPKRDQLEKELLNYAKVNNLPVLGVCRGMQMINDYYGGSLVDIAGHVVETHLLIGEWAKELGYQQVNSYHNKAVVAETLAQSLESLAITYDGVIEAVKHLTLPWIGIMWHPERESTLNKADKKLLVSHFNGFDT